MYIYIYMWQGPLGMMWTTYLFTPAMGICMGYNVVSRRNCHFFPCDAGPVMRSSCLPRKLLLVSNNQWTNVRCLDAANGCISPEELSTSSWSSKISSRCKHSRGQKLWEANFVIQSHHIYDTPSVAKSMSSQAEARNYAAPSTFDSRRRHRNIDCVGPVGWPSVRAPQLLQCVSNAVHPHPVVMPRWLKRTRDFMMDLMTSFMIHFKNPKLPIEDSKSSTASVHLAMAAKAQEQV